MALLAKVRTSKSLPMMMEAIPMLYIFFLPQSFHCSLYQTTKKQTLDLLYGKIRGRHLLVFVNQLGSNFFTSLEATRDEMEYIKQQENNLVPFEKIIYGKEIRVSFRLAFTMIDGKVCNAITHNMYTQRCYLRKATSKDFNNIDEILEKEVSEDHLQF